MTFNNSILSGTVLARENIQSEGYAAGASGWIVERDGDAEFNSIVVRGDVISVGALYTTRILDGEIIIELNSNPVKNVTITPLQNVYAGLASGTNVMLDFQDEASPLLGFRDTARTLGVYYDSDDGFLKVADWLTGTAEGWNNMTLPAGWTADVPCQYKLFPDGMVRFRGRANATVSPIPDGTAITTIPVGYRPAQQTIVPISFSTATQTGRLRVQSNGVVDVFFAPNDLPIFDAMQYSVI